VLASEGESRALAALRFSLASDIVELVVLTVDELFLQTLREGVGPARRLWHVLSSDKVSDLLVAGGVGILVLDVQALNEAAPRFVADIKRQFPDLVVLVAGNRESETELARLVSDGSIYRFIHKPMSPARARLFADAAVKRFEDRRRPVGEVSARAAAAPSQSRQILIPASAAALAVLLAAGWLVHRRNAEQPAVSSGNMPAQLTASTTQPLTAPLVSAAPVPAVQGVLMEAQVRLLARARTALDLKRLDEAASIIEAARKAGIATERVAQLATELAAAREQAKTPPAAAPPIASAPIASPPIASPPIASPPIASARADPARAASAPAASASVASPPAATAPAVTLPAAAVPTTEHPMEGRVIEAETGDAARGDDLMRSARRSIAQDHLVEPENDNAQYYLLALRKLDPRHAGLADLTEDLGGRLVAKGRASVGAQQYEAAGGWLDHAAAVGYVSPQADAVRHDLDAALARRAFMADVISANQLTLVKSVQPQYPLKAQQNSVEGWVELEFTVTETGAVEDVAVDAAKPPRVFEAAAITAVLQWRYKPLVRDAKAVATRARIRIRFALAR
jgi:TonB family protein